VAVAVLVALAAISAACVTHGDSVNAGPGLALDGDSFDLGEVPPDQTVERTIAFANDGQEPLEVSIVKVRAAPDAACGCGVEGFEVRPGTVAPGGSGELVFRLRVPEGMADMQDTMLAELQTNDPDNARPTIRLVFRMVS
jgi:hypothetical protein